MEHKNGILELAYANIELKQKIELLEAVVENFPGGLLLFDSDVRLVFCNENQKRLLEYPEELFADGAPSIEKIFWLNAHRGEYGEGDAAHQVAVRLDLVRKRVAHSFERIRPNGTVLRISGVPLASGGFMTTYLDVTKEHQNTKALAYLALHDIVTGLANRAAFVTELSKRIDNLSAGDNGAVIFIDLNGFKQVNDSFGHAAGDELLRLVGNRLRRSIRDRDFLARFGGDEFAIVQADVSTFNDVKALALRIRDSLGEFFEIRDELVRIGASIGVSIFPEHGIDKNELIALADSCMYKCKAENTGFTVSSVSKTQSVPPSRRRRITDEVAHEDLRYLHFTPEKHQESNSTMAK